MLWSYAIVQRSQLRPTKWLMHIGRFDVAWGRIDIANVVLHVVYSPISVHQSCYFCCPIHLLTFDPNAFDVSQRENDCALFRQRGDTPNDIKL